MDKVCNIESLYQLIPSAHLNEAVNTGTARKATAMLLIKMFGVEAMLTFTYKKVPGKPQLNSKITE